MKRIEFIIEYKKPSNDKFRVIDKIDVGYLNKSWFRNPRSRLEKYIEDLKDKSLLVSGDYKGYYVW